MKHKLVEKIKRQTVTILFFSLALSGISSDAVSVWAENENKSSLTEETVEEKENLIELSTAEELLEFAENCKLDAFSIGKRVELKNDINMLGISFSGIPYFNGVFAGNGYTISNLAIQENGSQYGMFRYIGELGVVSNLHILGKMEATGSQEEIGAIAGVNYGVIQNCSFIGTVSGLDSVGAIAGRNASTGQIIGCQSKAVVLAKDNTGGIAGVNAGIIDNCISECSINNEEFESTMDLEMIDIGTLNFVQTVVDRNNMGGIAGSSGGVIKDCVNRGTVGYAHTGYNVGGIAGSQKGIVLDCVNEGTIYGRKDVGGIVGQAEPYVESEYLSDQIDQTKEDISRINRTLNSMSANLEKNAAEARTYADALSAQLQGTTDSLSDRVSQMKDSISDTDAEAKQYMNNINAATKRIEEIQKQSEPLTKEDIEEIQKQMEIIEENTKKLSQMSKNREDFDSGSTGGSSGGGDNSNFEGLTDSIQNSVNTLTNGIHSVTSQTQTMIDNLYDSTAVIRGEKSFIVDISSIKTAAELDGVISGCINKGTIDADLNAGGIAGTMNIEYGEDPEEDLTNEDAYNVVTSSQVNDVILNSKNYGKVNCKKNNSGSVVGLQTFGYVYGCEGYGHVNASNGSYVGGIAGASSGTIEKCYAMLDISGKAYVGGIAGEGKIVTDCISVTTIETEGERIGGVVGFLETEGEAAGNLFVKDGYDGIDNISYQGVAEPVTYEMVMQKEEIPAGFTQMQVAFEAEEELISETTVAYGSSLTEEDFPQLVEREGYYIQWPDKSEYTGICNNVTITAEYIPWTQSIVASKKSEDGRPVFLAVGEFYADTALKLLPAETAYTPADGEQLLYSYAFSIESEREKTFETVEGHFYVPDSVEGEVSVWVWSKDTWWTKLSATEDGSYVVAEIPYGTVFAVVETAPDMTNMYLMAGAGIFVFVLVIIFTIIHNKRKVRKKQQK